MRLNKSKFHYATNVVTVSIDPALTTRTELQKLIERVLSTRSWIAHGVLEIVWSRIRRGVGLGPVQLAKARIVVLGGASVILNSRPRIEAVARAVGRADHE